MELGGEGKGRKGMGQDGMKWSWEERGGEGKMEVGKMWKLICKR